MSVKEAKQKIDAREFAGWKAYYDAEPFGDERADIRNAMLCQLVACGFGGKNFELSDFMVTYEKDKPTEEEVARKINAAFTQVLGANNG